MPEIVDPVEEDPKRRWSLDTARAMLAAVRGATASAFAEVEPLLARRAQVEFGSAEYRELDARIEKIINGWLRAMEALAVDVKGLWLVDFDNGQGYFCWKWPEESIDYFHGYDEGYDDRRRIQ